MPDLHTLIDQDRTELDLGKPGVSGTDASAADDVSHVKEFSLGLLPQHPETIFVA